MCCEKDVSRERKQPGKARLFAAVLPVGTRTTVRVACSAGCALSAALAEAADVALGAPLGELQ